MFGIGKRKTAANAYASMTDEELLRLHTKSKQLLDTLPLLADEMGMRGPLESMYTDSRREITKRNKAKR